MRMARLHTDNEIQDLQKNYAAPNPRERTRGM
jgi:hypothetical protein